MSNLPARILVVDDAPLLRGLLIQVLQKYGYEVAAAEDGQQAIDHFIKCRPDLILMDADMPILDGVAACARIRQLPEAKYLPIIIVTSYQEREWVDRAYAAGATDYVTKPVNWDVLRNRIHYILQAKHSEEALFDEKEKAQVTLASIGDGVITTDAQGQIEYLNPVATKLTGWFNEEAQGLSLSQVFALIDEVNGQPLEFPLNECLAAGKTVEIVKDSALLHRDGVQKFAIESSAAPIRDRDNTIIGVVLVFHDVTENRKLTQKLAYQAKHDPLTRLYNIHAFNVQLESVLQNQQVAETEHALLFMDLDQFKIINDTCGHDAGDQLLKKVALVLEKEVNTHPTFSKATLARLGGDEFGLLLECCSLESALEVGKHLCERIQDFKFLWTNTQHEKGIFTIGISIGLVPVTSTTVASQKSLMAMADAACYAAKNAGRNRVHVYQESDAGTDIHWVSLINDNLERTNGFSLFHQAILPLYPTIGKPKVCYEILLRMNNLQGQLVSPGAFLSIAERYNLMSTIDHWVVYNTLKWLTNHPDYLEKLTLVTINISGYSLADNHFFDILVQNLQQFAVPPRKLCFEISETTMITNFARVLKFITTLKAQGYRFAIDNFGSSMSSFTYVQDLSVDFLKIDGTLIRNIAKNSISYALVKSINTIAHLMDVQTIAESVETQEMFDKLKEIQVDYVQGYYLDKPKLLGNIG